MFWVDLTNANGMMLNMIPGNFSAASSTIYTTWTGSQVNSALPQSTLGGGNIYVFSNNGINYYGLGAVNKIGGTYGTLNAYPSLTVKQANDVDAKIDDGLPFSGRIAAYFILATQLTSSYQYWSSPGSSTTCNDNRSVVGGTNYYSTQINNGAGLNCAISVQFQ